MSIQLNEEQTKTWIKRSWYQMSIATAATVIAILSMLTPYGALIVTIVASGMGGVMAFIASMPRIYYYSSEPAEDQKT